MTSSQKPLVVGGHGKNPASLPSLFFSTTVPVIYPNTIIVAATHPNIKTANPRDDGWFISDFYAFNFLLKGLGAKQTWLTAADPHKLVAEYGPFLHGNPYETRRECLSYELLEKEELTPVTIVPTNQMIDRFLAEAKRGSEMAKEKDAPLLLLVFCHGLPNFHLLLDSGNINKGLSMVQLKGVLEFGANVTLVTTACYSGGWAVNPDFNFPAMAAASHLDDSSGQSNAWDQSLSIGRSCGSVFATTLMESLSSATSPFLDDEDQFQLAGSLGATSLLQPTSPNELQTMTYNEFCRSVWEICEQRVTRLWDHQSFSFSAKDDAWEYSWVGRTGIPLTNFETRWNTLTPYAYNGPAETREHRNVDPNNPYFLQSGPVKTGGVNTVVDEMTSSMAHGRIKTMARLFLMTSPGDWTAGYMPSLGGRMRAYYEGDGYEEDAPEFAATIRFRWEMGLLTDFLVKKFGLPIPSGEICIMWDRRVWEMDKKLGNRHQRSETRKMFDKIHRALDHCLEPPRRKDQGPTFYRPTEYFSAALFEGKQKWEETLNMIQEVRGFMADVVKFHRQSVVDDSRTQSRGKEWLKSLGRKARRSAKP
ncbi:hypothetical protein N7462_010367 [Penicillium macrosclerotiorum]|uniref:uncharacterized protein n=1 Tax=Penicillium macrosclerotiorum TaxID=303699 RepID=UPI0025470725|nr:uncharacterized protein N7462_010367 [Penicillium macrosclerotiorum]KAJ5669297.1 hypothetical protein N7462_010367 [Penicillium macrosclerotiorum]